MRGTVEPLSHATDEPLLQPHADRMAYDFRQKDASQFFVACWMLSLSHIAWLESRNMLIDRDWRAAVETCVFVGGVRREVGCKENAACAILPGTSSLWLDQ